MFEIPKPPSKVTIYILAVPNARPRVQTATATATPTATSTAIKPPVSAWAQPLASAFAMNIARPPLGIETNAMVRRPDNDRQSSQMESKMRQARVPLSSSMSQSQSQSRFNSKQMPPKELKIAIEDEETHNYTDLNDATLEDLNRAAEDNEESLVDGGDSCQSSYPVAKSSTEAESMVKSGVASYGSAPIHASLWKVSKPEGYGVFYRGKDNKIVKDFLRATKNEEGRTVYQLKSQPNTDKKECTDSVLRKVVKS